MPQDRFNQYRIMWIFVLFDLPTSTKEEMKAATKFRKTLIKDGFTMHQYSIYLRNCSSRENADVHARRIQKYLPKYGKISVMTVTDRQFKLMVMYYGKKEVPVPQPNRQLELF